MAQKGSKSIRLTGSALAITLALLTAPHAFAQGKTYAFNIPAESTSKALMDFSRQASVQILFPYEVVAGHTSPAIAGQYDRATVLRRLVDGSGLEIASESDQVITLKAVSQATGASAATEGPASPELVVTGSHIRGGTPTSPVHTITRADIDQSGYSQIGDVMRSLPENFAGGQNPGVLGASGSNINNLNVTNASTMNLRGLGSDATLVLVNGHRLAADNTFQGVDISGVPLSAVKRIEIVPDGASALYGSDAVAGVTNILLRKNYDGAEISGRLGGATQGGGAERTFTLLAGRSGTTGYALFNVEYSKQDAILAGQRDFASDMAADATLLQPQTRRSGFLSLGRTLSDSVAISLDALVADRDTTYVSHAFKAYAGYTGWAYTPSYSVTAMADISLGDQWKAHVTGGVAGSRNSTGLTYFGTDYPTYTTNSLRYIEATADGTALELPSGPLKVAIGAGVRLEGFQSGFGGEPGTLKPSRQVTYAYAEAQVPLVSPSPDRRGLHALEVNLSARTEHYSDFGSTTNPRIGLGYVPFTALTVRASWGKSFKAPSFFQMYQASSLTLYQPSILGGSNDGSTVMAVYGGNEKLKPERSTSWSFGGDFSPSSVPGLTLSLNAFDIRYTDRVVQPINPLTQALSNAHFAPFVARQPSAVAVSALVAQADSFDNYSGLPFSPSNVSAIAYDNYQNATAQAAHGIDLGYRQTFTVGGGTLAAFANASWLHLEQQTIETQPSDILSGTIFNAPDFKARGGVSWQRGGMSASGIVNFVGTETDTGVTPNAKIGSWTTVDANLTYSFAGPSAFARGLKVAVSVSNLFDRDPPRAVSPALAYEGLAFDSTNGSLIGRFASLTLTKAW